MNRLALAFFSTGALCVLGGMIWGVIMASSNDHSMMPAHAHLNLMGWATLALMGTFYALSGRQDRLGWANYWTSTLPVVVSIPVHWRRCSRRGNAAAERCDRRLVAGGVGRECSTFGRVRTAAAAGRRAAGH